MPLKTLLNISFHYLPLLLQLLMLLYWLVLLQQLVSLILALSVFTPSCILIVKS